MMVEGEEEFVYFRWMVGGGLLVVIVKSEKDEVMMEMYKIKQKGVLE